ncbi:MAG: hypothetical protein GEU80_07655 [Dehalococcoidia bacterium]|nr:hypothetical protein [Dehalococcoidia bacterium]
MTLPTFVLIGASRAGTTSTHHYLEEHPDVFVSHPKEPNYFLEEGNPKRNVKTLPAYEALFAAARPDQARGECSVSYFRDPVSAERIRALVPDVQLLLFLRQPADRAYSSYLLRRRGDSNVRERRGPEEALAGPREELVQESLYADDIQRYFDLFGRERFHIEVLEHFAQDPLAAMSRIYTHIGVDPTFRPDTSQRYNEGWAARNARVNAVLKHPAMRRAARTVFPRAVQQGIRDVARRNSSPPPPLSSELRARLNEFYRPDIERTGELIGRDLSFWLEAPPARTSAVLKPSRLEGAP